MSQSQNPRKDMLTAALKQAFLAGQEYQRHWDALGLSNILDIRDIVYAKERGAELKFTVDANNLTPLYDTHLNNADDYTRRDRMNELVGMVDWLADIIEQELSNPQG